MLVRTRIGVSLDGYVATGDRRPVLLSMPDFVPGESHGYPEFAQNLAAVAMGRTTFEPAVGAPRWPWPGLQVYVLTTRPLPPGSPDDVETADSPGALLDQLAAARLDGDVHLVGGPLTLRALLELGAIDRLEVLLLPIIVGEGVPFSAPGTAQRRLRLERQRRFADGTLELVYTPG